MIEHCASSRRSKTKQVTNSVMNMYDHEPIGKAGAYAAFSAGGGGGCTLSLSGPHVGCPYGTDQLISWGEGGREWKNL